MLSHHPIRWYEPCPIAVRIHVELGADFTEIAVFGSITAHGLNTPDVRRQSCLLFIRCLKTSGYMVNTEIGRGCLSVRGKLPIWIAIGLCRGEERGPLAGFNFSNRYNRTDPPKTPMEGWAARLGSPWPNLVQHGRWECPPTRNVYVKNVFAKLQISLIALALLFVFGTLGYVVIGGRELFESFYVTVVILTTVGMKETGLPLSQAEQWWTIFLMIAGIGTAIYATGNVVAFFIDGQIREVLGRRQLMNQINNMQDHFIVVGFGRMGQALCATLHYKEVPFVLIDPNEDVAVEADRLGYLYLRGDAMQEEALLMAGIDRARGLATCISDDADNVFVTLTARSLNERLHIIARAEAHRTEAKLLRAGANRVICPVVMGAGMLTHLLLNPQVEEILELDGNWPDLEVTKLNIHRFPNSIGKPLKFLFSELDRHVMVVAKVGVDGVQRYNPSVDEVLEDGDEIVVVGPAGSITQITRVLEMAA